MAQYEILCPGRVAKWLADCSGLPATSQPLWRRVNPRAWDKKQRKEGKLRFFVALVYKEALQGYKQFQSLVEQYVQLMVQKTRADVDRSRQRVTPLGSSIDLNHPVKALGVSGGWNVSKFEQNVGSRNLGNPGPVS
jgi:hypothetical protein